MAAARASACSGSVLLARQRRWEALLLGVVLLAVTAVGDLLVASPRRVLVTMPLVAALAGVGAAGLARGNSASDIDPLAVVNARCAPG